MIFGWDISTSIVGVTALTDEGRFVTSKHVDLRKVDGVFDKANVVQEFVYSFLSDYNGEKRKHFVEERLSNFAMGRSMLQTLMTLASFNLLVSWFLWEMGKDVTYIHPSTVKSIMRKDGLIVPKGGDKKKLTLDFVSKREPGFVVDLNRNDKPQPWCYDKADSYITARAGFLRAYLSNDATGEKATGDQAGPGTRAARQRG